MFQNIKTENREEETINSYTKKKKKKNESPDWEGQPNAKLQE